MRRASAVVLVTALLCSGAAADDRIVNADAHRVVFRGRKALEVRPHTHDGNHDGLVVLAGPDFHDGTIELEVAGDVAPDADAAARGFVGLAFRLAGDTDYELFYLRPTNGRADDQLRRNHALQYVSEPDFPWERLRKETPGLYESYADLQPGVWTRMRIEVTGTRARLFVNGATQPSLIVGDLKHGDRAGAIAYWVGPGTIGHFRGLKIVPAP